MPTLTKQPTLNIDRIRSILASEEGFRPDVYKDTEGFPTVGYGFRTNNPYVPQDVRAGKRQMTRQEADAILQTRLIPIAIQDAQSYVGSDVFSRLDPERQLALIDLAYNLGGPKLNSFKNMRAALLSGNYDQASAELLNSLYAKQVPNRAKRNYTTLKTGARR